ncbi:hypothetical protein HZA97_08120 [Candidatus Woesearchaeota archaeon]|nr:hypothetical protein [Candidatus Woesearchaeota archaeon]
MSIKRGLKNLVCSVPLILGLSGCFGYMIPGENFKREVEKPGWVKEYFSYPKAPIDYQLLQMSEKEHYTIKTLTFHSAMHTKPLNDFATVDYYDIKGEEKTPLIILSPILGGKNTLSEMFAEYYADRGFACAIVHRPNDKFPDNNNYAQGLEDILKQSLIDTMRAIDILQEFPDIDKDKIGSLGISLGAIKNATLAGIDERLKVNIFVMGGADIPYILEHTKEGGIVEELQGIADKKKLFEQLRETIRSDPKYLAPFINDKNTLMYITLFDNVVPIECQRKLKKLIGNPSVVYLLAGHYTAFMYILPPFRYVQKTSYEFFKKKFAETDKEQE